MNDSAQAILEAAQKRSDSSLGHGYWIRMTDLEEILTTHEGESEAQITRQIIEILKRQGFQHKKLVTGEVYCVSFEGDELGKAAQEIADILTTSFGKRCAKCGCYVVESVVDEIEIAERLYDEYWFSEETIQEDGGLRPSISFPDWLNRRKNV